jgi:hypothetical protein
LKEKEEEEDGDEERQTGKEEETETDSEFEEDQDGDPWSVLVDLYTRMTRFKAESKLDNKSRTLVQLS